jgi:hypothetical protein
MKTTDGITLDTVKEVYDGAVGDLWELIPGIARGTGLRSYSS